ncbi:hypothetical protein Tco_0068915, partial [Tanacetum coccineum]
QNPSYLKQAQRKHQSLYNGKVLLENHDPPVVHDSEETLQLAQESRQVTRIVDSRLQNFEIQDSCAYRVFNRRTKKIMETMNVTFDELSAMAFEQSSLKPELQSMTSGQISLGLNLTYAPSTITTQQPIERVLDLLFEVMYDDYIGGQPSDATRTNPAAQAP